MRHDEHRPPGAQVRHDVVVPVGQHPHHDVLEALGARHHLVGQVRVRRVADLRPLVAVGQGRGRCVVGPAPQHELLLAELGEGLLLVLALQRPVVALVEPPAAPHRQPHPVGGVQRDLRGPDRAAHHRGVQHVRQQAALGEQLTAPARLGRALLGQADVDPAGEEVLLVPVALAVPEQDEGGVLVVARAHAAEPARNGVRAVGVSAYGRLPEERGTGDGIDVGWLRDARPDGVGSAAHVLVAVGRHPGQPGRRVRAAVPGVLPHRRAGPHAVVRRAGARRVRPGQHPRPRWWAACWPTGWAGGRCCSAASWAPRPRWSPWASPPLRGRARAGRPARADQQHLAAGLLGDDDRHRGAGRTGCGRSR